MWTFTLHEHTDTHGLLESFSLLNLTVAPSVYLKGVLDKLLNATRLNRYKWILCSIHCGTHKESILHLTILIFYLYSVMYLLINRQKESYSGQKGC